MTVNADLATCFQIFNTGNDYIVHGELVVSSLDIAFFTSGLGDGSYKSYITYDAGNDICQFITDVGIFLEQ